MAVLFTRGTLGSMEEVTGFLSEALGGGRVQGLYPRNKTLQFSTETGEVYKY